MGNDEPLRDIGVHMVDNIRKVGDSHLLGHAWAIAPAQRSDVLCWGGAGKKLARRNRAGLLSPSRPRQSSMSHSS